MHSRGTKISENIEEKIKDVEKDRAVSVGVSDTDSDLLGVHSDIIAQEGQLLSELAETDDLLGSSKDSLVETGATKKLEDLFLGSDEEHEITMISVHVQEQVKDLPASEASSA